MPRWVDWKEVKEPIAERQIHYAGINFLCTDYDLIRPAATKLRQTQKYAGAFGVTLNNDKDNNTSSVCGLAQPTIGLHMCGVVALLRS